jgi:glucokinase
MRGGVDLGGTKIEVLLIEDERTIVGRSRNPTPTEGGAEAVVAAIAKTVEDAAASVGVETSSLSGVGVGSPGAVDEEQGTVGVNSNLAGGWRNPYPFAAELGERLGTRVRVANDVEVAASAEQELGSGRGLRSWVAIWWGTGLGGAVILNGERWLGNGSAGEIGHMVVKLNGRVCPCGRRGCAEAYAGRAAMEDRARRLHARGQKTKLFDLMEKANRDRLSSSIWEKALDADDPLARELFDDAYDAMGAVAGSVANLLDIDGFVLGGGLGTRFGARAAEAIHEKMRPHVFNPARDPVIVPAALGDDGGAIGAALLVRSLPPRRP